MTIRRSIRTAVRSATSRALGGRVALPSVPSAPVFTTQPSTQTVTEGDDVTFTVVVVGSPTPTGVWQSNDGGGWVNISGETARTLVLFNVALSLDGTQYRYVATNDPGTTNSNAATLTVEALVVNVPPAFDTAPTISGDANVGNVLTRVEGTASGTPTPTITGIWTRDNVPIDGEVASTYTSTIDDDGSIIRFQNTAANIEGEATSDSNGITVLLEVASSELTYNADDVLRNILKANAPPSVAGTRKVLVGVRFKFVSRTQDDVFLSSDTGGSGNFKFYLATATQPRLFIGGRQVRCATDSFSATDDAALMALWVAIDTTATGVTNISRCVISRSSGITSVVTSGSTVINGDEFNMATVFNGGMAMFGISNTLADAMDGSIKDFYVDWGDASMELPADLTAPQFAFDYEWGENGIAVTGRIPKRRYSLTVASANSVGGVPNAGSGEVAPMIALRDTATYPFVADPSGTPAFTAPVNTVAPSITGTAQVGEILTGVAGTWTGNPTPTITYQWLADDVAISGATSTTYTQVTGDIGAVIKYRETATNIEGTVVATSTGTSAVAAAPTSTKRTLSNPRSDIFGAFILFDVAEGTWNHSSGVNVDPTKVTVQATVPSVDGSGTTANATEFMTAGLRAEFESGVLKMWLEDPIFSEHTSITVTLDEDAIVSGTDGSAALTSTAVTNNNTDFGIPLPAAHFVGVVEDADTLLVNHSVVRNPWRAEVAGIHRNGIAGVEWTITKNGGSPVVTWQDSERRSWYRDRALIDGTQFTTNAGGTLEGGLGVWPSASGAASSGTPSSDTTGAVTIQALVVPTQGGRASARTLNWTVYSAQAGAYPLREVWLDTVDGNDSNDGLSVGAPKLTMTAACNVAGSVTGGATSTSVPIVYVVGGTALAPRTIELSVPTSGSGNAIPSATDTYLTIKPAATYDADMFYVVNHDGPASGYNSRVRRLCLENLTVDISDSPSGTSSTILVSGNASVYPLESNPQEVWFRKCVHTHRQGKIGQLSEVTTGALVGSNIAKPAKAHFTEWTHTDTGQRGISAQADLMLRDVSIINIQKDTLKEPECIFGFYAEDNAVDERLLPVSGVTGTPSVDDVITGVYSFPASATLVDFTDNVALLTEGDDSYDFKADDSKTHVAITITGETGTIVVGEVVRNAANTARFEVFRRDGNILRGRYEADSNSIASGITLTGVTSGATATVDGSPATNQVNLFFSPSGARATAGPPHPDGLQIQSFYSNRILLSAVTGTYEVGETITGPRITGGTVSGVVVSFDTDEIVVSGTGLWQEVAGTVTGSTSGATGTLVYSVPIDADANILLANGVFRTTDGQILFGENGSSSVGIYNVLGCSIVPEGSIQSQFASISGLVVAHSTLPNQRLSIRGILVPAPIPGNKLFGLIVQEHSADYQAPDTPSGDDKGKPGTRIRMHYTNTGTLGFSRRPAGPEISIGDPLFVDGIGPFVVDDATALDFRPTATIPTVSQVTTATTLAKYDLYGVERLATDWPGAISSRTP